MVGDLQLAEAAIVETVGAVVQGSLGFGINLVAAPLLELIDPSLVPVPIILAGILSGALVARREWGTIDRRGVTWALGGRVPGTAAGTAVILLAPGRELRAAVAGVVVAAVLLSVVGWRVRRTPGALLGTGAVSGVMGTVAGLGGTPMGLVYQDEEGPTVRATLSTYSLIGACLSLVALALFGRIDEAQLVLAAVLAPGVVMGFVLSARLRGVLDKGRLRPAILALAGVSSLVVLAQSL